MVVNSCCLVLVLGRSMCVGLCGRGDALAPVPYKIVPNVEMLPMLACILATLCLVL